MSELTNLLDYGLEGGLTLLVLIICYRLYKSSCSFNLSRHIPGCDIMMRAYTRNDNSPQRRDSLQETT